MLRTCDSIPISWYPSILRTYPAEVIIVKKDPGYVRALKRFVIPMKACPLGGGDGDPE